MGQVAGARIPDPETAEGIVNIGKLLEARDSEEIREFRDWLRTLDEATDEAIKERVDSIRAKMSSAVHRDAGQTTRFVATTGVGFIPVVGPIAGIALGAADQFCSCPSPARSPSSARRIAPSSPADHRRYGT